MTTLIARIKEDYDTKMRTESDFDREFYWINVCRSLGIDCRTIELAMKIIKNITNIGEKGFTLLYRYGFQDQQIVRMNSVSDDLIIFINSAEIIRTLNEHKSECIYCTEKKLDTLVIAYLTKFREKYPIDDWPCISKFIICLKYIFINNHYKICQKYSLIPKITSVLCIAGVSFTIISPPRTTI